jgi:hypothetical protein
MLFNLKTYPNMFLNIFRFHPNISSRDVFPTDRRFDQQQITLTADLNIPPGSGGPWPGIGAGPFFESARHEIGLVQRVGRDPQKARSGQF